MTLCSLFLEGRRKGYIEVKFLGHAGRLGGVLHLLEGSGDGYLVEGLLRKQNLAVLGLRL